MEFTVRLYKFNIMLSLRPKSSNGLVLLFEVLIFMYEALCNKPNTLISVVHRPRSGQSRLIAEVSSSHAITPTPTPTLSLSRYDCSKRVLSSLQRPLPTQHSTNIRDKYLCLQWDSNPRFQQSSGCREHKPKYRVIHKSLRDFRTRLRNNQDRHGRKEHINR